MRQQQLIRRVTRFPLYSRTSLQHKAIITSFLGPVQQPRVQVHNSHSQCSLATASSLTPSPPPPPPSSSSSSSSSLSVPHIRAPDLAHARLANHIDLAAAHLQNQGILKITLDFPDPESTYLQHLIASLHQHHGHQLPISHSASRGWFWDVRPTKSNFQTDNHQARSETMAEFPWHTDCSYEDPTPRLFALQVLRHDHLGGGTLSVTNVDILIRHLSPRTRLALQRDEFQIAIPREFVKSPEKTSITGRLLSTSRGQGAMRFRHDILTPLTPAAASALTELNAALSRLHVLAPRATLHLKAADLPSGSIILIDNFRWLHARNDIKDPARHLRRVRWDAVPFAAIL